MQYCCLPWCAQVNEAIESEVPCSISTCPTRLVEHEILALCRFWSGDLPHHKRAFYLCGYSTSRKWIDLRLSWRKMCKLQTQLTTIDVVIHFLYTINSQNRSAGWPVKTCENTTCSWETLVRLCKASGHVRLRITMKLNFSTTYAVDCDGWYQ